MRTQEKAATCKPGGGSGDTRQADGLLVGFWPPELRANPALLSNPPNLCYFIMAALAN